MPPTAGEQTLLTAAIGGMMMSESPLKTAHSNMHRKPAINGTKPGQALMFAPEYAPIVSSQERKGVVYTKDWVVRFILDLAGYTAERNLVDTLAIEPAAGEGAFLSQMAQRLVLSCRRQNRPLSDCASSLIAFELDAKSSALARAAIVESLAASDVPTDLAASLASSWVRTGDYLFEAFRLPNADFVIGNPPYVRLEDIPEEAAGIYRRSYPTMMGRADLYVAFFEAGLRQLRPNGICAFICADRWMLNQYGAELRNLVTSAYSVDAIVDMHHADAFQDEVSAYPAITILRKGRQGNAVVAAATKEAASQSADTLAQAVGLSANGVKVSVPGLAISTVASWFTNSDPWPCSSPKRLELLRRIEERFPTLESETLATKVGIGVATGLDEVFITKNPGLVEESRLLPLALARDTLTGHLQWSGHYLVDPWNADGLVDLNKYPRLKSYFEANKGLLKKRHTAQKSTHGWYRTIDRVAHPLRTRPKLYIPDIKDCFNPVLDSGETYPHHNLYFIQSDKWDLEVLGGILLSAVAQFFVECYGVRMRGGYLRFQAQYLRRVRVPDPDSLTANQCKSLKEAFQTRNRTLATKVSLSIYGIAASDLEKTSGH